MTRMQIQVQTQAMSTRNAIQSQWVRYTNVHLEQLRTVPPLVTEHTFCAFGDIRVS